MPSKLQDTTAGAQGDGGLYEAMALDERASEGEDAELDDAEDFKSEESEIDDEATLEEEEVGEASHLLSLRIPTSLL